MEKFELGFAFRGTTAPEVKQVVEARSMREAMLAIINQYGGDDVVLVTSAHYVDPPLPPRAGIDYSPLPRTCPAAFMLAAE